MANGKNRSQVIEYSFFALLALLLVTPLAFTKYIENGYELTKAASLKVLGGIFIIIFAMYLIAKFKEKKNAGEFVLIDKNIDPFALFFLIAALLSTLFSIKPYISYYGQYDRQIGFITYFYVFLIYFFSSSIFKEAGKIAACIKLMEAAAVIVATYAFLQVLHIDPFDIPIKNYRANSTFGNSIFAGGFLVLVFPFSLTKVFLSKKKLLKVIITVVILFGVVVTQTRAAYVALIIETGAILLLYPLLFKGERTRYIKLIKNGILATTIILLALALLMIFLHDNLFINRFISIASLPKLPRWLLWRDSFKVFWLHPITGSGIATFSNVFEYIITPGLRRMETEGYYDNAHNNSLQILCTMGAVGAIAYVSLLFQSIRISLKGILAQTLAKEQKLLFLACLSSISGYVVFGMADFDDLAILLYIFTILAILKASYAKNFLTKKNPDISKSGKLKIVSIVATAMLISFAAYNVYESYNDIIADKYYKDGRALYSEGNFYASIQAMNKAVILNSKNSTYKYMLASFVYNYCSKNTELKPEIKNNLLKQAEEELMRAQATEYSALQRDALLSMIYYEMGRAEESDSLKNEVFKYDSLMIPLRNNIAYNYFKYGNYDNMSNELNFILKYDPGNIDALFTYEYYYFKMNDLEKAKEYCEKILKLDPQNKAAMRMIEELKNRQK